MTVFVALVAFAVLFAVYGLLARRAGCGSCADRDAASQCAVCPHADDSDTRREVER